jgi:hypothetical protein
MIEYEYCHLKKYHFNLKIFDESKEELYSEDVKVISVPFKIALSPDEEKYNEEYLMELNGRYIVEIKEPSKTINRKALIIWELDTDDTEKPKPKQDIKNIDMEDVYKKVEELIQEALEITPSKT